MLLALVTPSPAAVVRASMDHRLASRDGHDFHGIYEEHFDFVWRSLKRLGVGPEHLDDAAQDTFLVVLRRLDDFQGASTVRTWVFGIVLRVAKDYRRRAARKPTEALAIEPAAPAGSGPEAATERKRAVDLLHRLLDQLDDGRRAVFVLAELEQMSAPEIADALDINVNTVYSRLRSARRTFARALARSRSRRPS